MTRFKLRLTLMIKLIVSMVSVNCFAENETLDNKPLDLSVPERPAFSYEEAERTPVPLPPDLEQDPEHAIEDAFRFKDLVENKASQIPFLILPHKPNYLMPFTYQDRPYDEPYEDFTGEDDWPGLTRQEAAFQISFKYKIVDLPGNKNNKLYMAYTNRSFWQVYNDKISRPFRETNHEPELLAMFKLNSKYINRAYLSLSHQSNGQFTEFSRSWNRIILGAFHIGGDTVVGITPWWRIPETKKADPNDPSDNDNPDIDDYMGYAEFIFAKAIGPRYFAMTLRNNLRTEKNYGAVELEWNFPITPRVKGFFQYFEGYGESLIEYNHYQKRLGFGFKVSDYL